MPLKEIRDLAEHMKLLGFPRTIPLQALCNKQGSLSGFRVVAEILQWLAELLEPGIKLLGSCTTESDRILLIRSATEFFVTKSGIKLNPRKLYASSDTAATELQKIIKLFLALPCDEDAKIESENSFNLNQIDIGDEIDDLRRAREIATDLVNRGSALHKLLSQETVNKEFQLTQPTRPMELASVDRTLKNAIGVIQINLQSSKVMLENSRIEMNAISSKFQRKESELERTRQRLEALQKIRPPHIQEFEECEHELQKLFQKYFQRIHVRDALKSQLSARTKKTSPSLSPIPQKPLESSMTLIPEGLIDDDENDNIDIKYDMSVIRDKDILFKETDNDVITETMTSARPGTATYRGRPTTGRRQTMKTKAKSDRKQVIGSGRSDSQDEETTFGSSDDELNLGAGIEIDVTNLDEVISAKEKDESEFCTDDDISILKISGELPLRPMTANKPEHLSDEDF